MSALLSDRLLLTFVNVKHRLESLLNLCRISENPSWTNDDDGEEFYRFFGPYQSDIEELEKSITHVSSLIENLQHEQNTTEDCKPFPNYPLCENGWTFKEIEQLEEEPRLNLVVVHQLALQTLTKTDHQAEEQQSSTINFNVSLIFPLSHINCSSFFRMRMPHHRSRYPPVQVLHAFVIQTRICLIFLLNFFFIFFHFSLHSI